jgi:glycosyltransferase involved in cell wall biosynthesis
MKFSICIPNYNYARYLGRTIQSVLDQEGEDFEILFSDNASTDDSVEVVRRIGDPRIKIHCNACNVGFAGNVQRSSQMASGDLMIMLSSDDLIRPGALATYRKLYEHLGAAGEGAITSSSWNVIDPDDKVTGEQGAPGGVWREADRQPELEQLLGAKVYGVPAQELLKRCLAQMINPFNFAATVYASPLYRKVEGYGHRMINPDKWFHWKVLAVAQMAYFVDQKLFAYRWHPSNQTAQQASAGSLKYMVDEYTSTLELEDSTLKAVGMTRDDLLQAFVEYDIARHGLATLARGSRSRARRILDFGRAVYPAEVRRNPKAKLLRSLLALGPVGQMIAARAYRSYQSGDDAA